MNFKKQVSLSKNTVIAYLKTDTSDQICQIVSTVRSVKPNPTGGWREWRYNEDYDWSIYQSSRGQISGFNQEQQVETWCEIGFSPIPFLNGIPSDWNIIGISEHPYLWIEKALKFGFHKIKGDGVDFLIPETTEDYAKLWCFFTNKLINNGVVFRFEDLLSVASIPDLNVWDVVSKIAEKLGYTETGCVEYYPKVPVREFIETSNFVYSVSVVVAARNNGDYLRDALHSVINQSCKPIEIIYVDDGSTDNSLEVAWKFKEVKVISKPWSGVCESRNMGAKQAKGEFLLHLDGDDILPYWYIEYRIKALTENPNASFAYGNAQAFGGGFNQFWTCPEWSSTTLWAANFCNTPSLLRREHFLNIGGWREGVGTAWDWDLYTRFSQAGYNGVYDKNAFMLYRHHDKSISAHQNLKNEKTSKSSVEKMNYLCRNLFCRTQIGAIVSDRLIDLFPTWIDAIVENIEEYRKALVGEEPFPYFGKTPYNKPNLNILFTGDPKHRSFINEHINRVSENFHSITVCFDRWTNVFSTEEERRSNVARFLAKSYNRLLETDCEFVWFLEDDVIPPVNAMKDLNRAITSGATPLYAVAGVYRNRHDTSHIIAHDWSNLKDIGSIKNFKEFPSKDQYVDMTGTGCLMIFRPYASHKFESHVKGVPAHDWTWCLGLKNFDLPPIKKVLLLSNVRCRHYQTLTEFI